MENWKTLLSRRHYTAPGVSIFLTFVAILAARAADTPEPFVWGETTEVAHAGWGRMVCLKDGRWVCVTTRFSRPNSVLQFKTSKDNAKIWAFGTTVAETG